MNEHNQRPLVASDVADIVSKLIRLRRKRGFLFSPGLFSDPAWDILLVLFRAELRHQKMTMSQVARATWTPPTTSLRWIETLEGNGWVRREPDPFDQRRTYVEISAQGSNAMGAWLSEGIASLPDQVENEQIRNVLDRIGRGRRES